MLILEAKVLSCLFHAKQKLLCAWIMLLAGWSKVNSFERLALTRIVFIRLKALSRVRPV